MSTPSGKKSDGNGKTPKGSAKAAKAQAAPAASGPDKHDQFVRGDVLARLRSLVGDEDGGSKGEVVRGVRPVLLSLDPLLYAYFEEEAKRRNKLVKTGRLGAKTSVHALLLDALRVRLPEMGLYRGSSIMVSRRREALGLVTVTVRVPMMLHQDLEKLAMAVPREQGTRAMYVKTIGEGLAFAWATSVNHENLFQLENEHATRKPSARPSASRAGARPKR